MLRIYYNPKCSKSRAALERMDNAGLAPQVINYLTAPPQRAQLEALIDKLVDPAKQLLRQRTDSDEPTDAEVVEALLTAPESMQRPIIETGTTAFIARPPERLDAFLDLGGNHS